MENRLSLEWGKIWDNPIPNIMVGLKNGNILVWRASITGPVDTPYYGGLFIMEIYFLEGYPERAPIFRMITPIFHVNINPDGIVCINVLKNGYNPDFEVGYLISCITVLLTIPNADDPFNKDAFLLFKADRKAYDEKAKQMTLEHAM